MKTLKLFFANLFDSLIGKIISVKIAASEEKMRTEFNLTELGNRELLKSLSDSVSDIEASLTPEKIGEIKDPSLKVSSDGRFKIRIEKSANRDIREYHCSSPIYTKGSSIYHLSFPDLSDMTKENQKIVKPLFETNVCVALFIKPLSISFEKSKAVGWEEVSPKIIEIIFNFLSEQYPNQKVDPTNTVKE